MTTSGVTTRAPRSTTPKVSSSGKRAQGHGGAPAATPFAPSKLVTRVRFPPPALLLWRPARRRDRAGLRRAARVGPADRDRLSGNEGQHFLADVRARRDRDAVERGDDVAADEAGRIGSPARNGLRDLGAGVRRRVLEHDTEERGRSDVDRRARLVLVDRARVEQRVPDRDAKPRCGPEVDPAVTIPMARPSASWSGPPESPGCTGAFVAITLVSVSALPLWSFATICR